MPCSLLLTRQFWSGFGRAKGQGLGHRELGWTSLQIQIKEKFENTGIKEGVWELLCWLKKVQENFHVKMLSP